jgi:hypothetical protein
MNKSLLNANPIMNMDILPNPALNLKQQCNNREIRNNGKQKREREAWVAKVRFPLVPLLFSWTHPSSAHTSSQGGGNVPESSNNRYDTLSNPKDILEETQENLIEET